MADFRTHSNTGLRRRFVPHPHRRRAAMFAPGGDLLRAGLDHHGDTTLGDAG
ncbi:hypothetical protein [Methylobacterium sp. WL103]|uniref:hypothetical protein n=1 Tax=Methylobacterium sp. WL103 TaxID=2603891 RepID=UPI001650AB44|nr:hypothetical protein [Methylobacterium sp. WL103]